ncbi:hypothetical protein EB796_004975 [Bugula neritina]|uniref:Uncharacterized protein n=1 Tax=Bugula neritina TaxID=10212 RepID=A0A7J7KER7_BUGNE|nr:hypothetical protein EB796_004975 [Bugula neritina]
MFILEMIEKELVSHLPICILVLPEESAVYNMVYDANLLIFLSYCRGGIPPQYNRTPHSFESSSDFPWPENEVTVMYQPIRRGFDETLRRQEWSRQPTFPPLDVPVDCYIMFSTLPDSKSKPGLMFKCLSEHLRDLTSDYRSKLLTPATSSSDDIEEQTDRKLSTDDSVLPDERKDKPVMRVNLLDLLTDVAGIMRDTSRSTQYANLCYTVDRNSQQICIGIFKPSS